MEKYDSDSLIRSAEILCVGTELLIGDIVNTNAAFLSKELASLGISVFHQSVVGDNPERLAKALEEALDRADLVITSGGLGPTYDDLTKETVAKCFDRKMFMHEPSLERIKKYFERTNRVMTKNNEKQAMMPEGAIIFDNPRGTAPGLALCDGENGKTVIMLPGPPRELEPMFAEKCVPYLKKRCGDILFSRNIHICGMGESMVEEKLGDLMKTSTNPTVAPYCKEGEVRLRVTAKAPDDETGKKLCDEMIKKIAQSEVGKFIYGIDVDSAENGLVELLLKKGLTCATAESCTGGLIAKRITDIPGSSAAFVSGVVSYCNEIKMGILGVKKETIDKYTEVSKECAVEMARGIREKLGSDIGISTTGYAGPGGGSEKDPVGTVYIAIDGFGKTVCKRLSLSSMRERSYIRAVAATNALTMAINLILEE